MSTGRQGWPATRRAVMGGFAAGAIAAARAQPAEAVLDPDLPIIDPHHHLWGDPGAPGAYLPPQLLTDIASGHRIVGTVFVECSTHYRTSGPPALRPVGEMEFVADVTRGLPRVAVGRVGAADLRLGDAVEPVLEALAEASGGHLRGIRQSTAYDPAPLFGQPQDPAIGAMPDDAKFREGFGRLARAGLSFDAWCFHPQLAQLARFAAAFPNTPVVLDHIGSPLGAGPYAGHLDEVFAAWRAGIRQVAARPNVTLKFGGLGMAFTAPFPAEGSPHTSEALAARWRPWFEVCVDAFGPRRLMFESNFPVDRPGGAYRVLWNAFKRLSAGFSGEERRAMFGGVAQRFYRLPPALLTEAKIV